MAALLRHAAARKLGGSVVQRAQTAVAEGRRRLWPRLVHTEQQAHGEIVGEVQHKIDELYDLINKGEENARTSTLPNAWLLQYLTDKVTPRPYDPEWSHMEICRKVIRRFRIACLYSLTYVAVDFYCGYSDDKKVAPAMMMEEEHEAREVET